MSGFVALFDRSGAPVDARLVRTMLDVAPFDSANADVRVMDGIALGSAPLDTPHLTTVGQPVEGCGVTAWFTLDGTRLDEAENPVDGVVALSDGTYSRDPIGYDYGWGPSSGTEPNSAPAILGADGSVRWEPPGSVLSPSATDGRPVPTLVWDGLDLVAFDVEPAVRHEVARQEVAQTMRLGREAVPDDPHAVEWWVVVRFPRIEELVEHRIQTFLRRVPRLHDVLVQARLVDPVDRGVRVGVRGEQDAVRVGKLLSRTREPAGVSDRAEYVEHVGHGNGWVHVSPTQVVWRYGGDASYAVARRDLVAGTSQSPWQPMPSSGSPRRFVDLSSHTAAWVGGREHAGLGTFVFDSDETEGTTVIDAVLEYPGRLSPDGWWLLTAELEDGAHGVAFSDLRSGGTWKPFDEATYAFFSWAYGDVAVMRTQRQVDGEPWVLTSCTASTRSCVELPTAGDVVVLPNP